MKTAMLRRHLSSIRGVIGGQPEISHVLKLSFFKITNRNSRFQLPRRSWQFSLSIPSHKTEMEFEDYIVWRSDYEEDSEEDGHFEEEDLYDDENEIQPRFVGYEYEFVDEVSQNQKCPVCLFPMRDAVQTSNCGHRFCRDCLQQILR